MGNMKVIGIELKEGVFEGTSYSNVNFHCTNPFNNETSAGVQTKAIKVKSKVLSENMGRKLEGKDIFAFVGKEVNFFYDEYKNVSFVQLIQKETSRNS